jgi:hypothetical protein
MSPTSCHCSTPRHVADRHGLRREDPQRPRLPGNRSPSTLRRCGGSRPGSGWDRVGPPRSRPRVLPAHAPRRPPHVSLGAHHHATARRERDAMRPAADPPSTIRTGRLRSVARRPPPAYQPGRLPGVLPGCPVGKLVLGGDSRLDAFSGSPLRTWLPNGAGCPTIGPPAVRPARSSRTRASVPQFPTACGG